MINEDNQQTYTSEEIKNMVERYNPNIIIDGKGTEERVSNSVETVISKPPHQLGLTTFSEYIDVAQKRAEEQRAESLWKDEVKIDIQTPYKWFAVQAWGDFHVGSSGCDYEKVKELLAGPLQYDNLKTITLGNLGDFFTPMGSPPDGLEGDVLPVQAQMFALKKFLTEQQDNILSSVNEPDHADWVWKSSGIDVYEFLGKELDIPLVNAGGITTLNFGEISYNVMAFHKITKFKSDINLTHSGKQALRLHRDADVVLSGHDHKPAFEWAFFNNHEVEIIHIGTCETLETGSMHGKKQGFLGQVRSVYPVILFNTEKKQMVVVPDVERAEPYLDLK